MKDFYAIGKLKPEENSNSHRDETLCFDSDDVKDVVSNSTEVKIILKNGDEITLERKNITSHTDIEFDDFIESFARNNKVDSQSKENSTASLTAVKPIFKYKNEIVFEAEI